MNEIDEGVRDNGATVNVTSASTATDPAASAAQEVPEPKAGGSYVRNQNTGELERVAGPVLDDQPEQEQ